MNWLGRRAPLHLSEDERRLGVERELASFRLLVAVVYAVATLVEPGDDVRTTMLIGTFLAGIAVVVATRVRLGHVPPAGAAVRIFLADYLVFALVLANNLDDPYDPVYFGSTLVVVEGGLRWGIRGGLASAALTAASVGVWTARVAPEGANLAEMFTIRTAFLAALGFGVGALVRSLRGQVGALHVAFDGASDGMLAVDASGAIVHVNDAAAGLLGLPVDHLIGVPLAEVVDDEQAEAQPTLGAGRRRVVAPRLDGSRVLLDASISELPASDLLYVILRDVTEEAEVALQLEEAASTDAVTGLYNRRRCEYEFAARCQEPGAPAALLFVDLDGFKEINDTHGHALGDALLRAVAGRFRTAVRDEDHLARYGGDEFCVLLGETGHGVVDDVAQRLLAAVREPFHVDGVLAPVSCSIGIAIRRSGERSTEVLRRADAAMYEAKRSGGGCARYAAGDG